MFEIVCFLEGKSDYAYQRPILVGEDCCKVGQLLSIFFTLTETDCIPEQGFIRLFSIN